MAQETLTVMETQELHVNQPALRKEYIILLFLAPPISELISGINDLEEQAVTRAIPSPLTRPEIL